MPATPAGLSPPAPFADADTCQALLDVSLTALTLLRPLYAPDTGELADFACLYLNPAGQQMLGQPAQPAETLLATFPAARDNGLLAFYRRVFETGEPGCFEVNYQADGLDDYFHVAARRQGSQLCASFTDTATQDRTPVETALRASQATERAARAGAEAQRQGFYDVLAQLPAQVATYDGPGHVYAFVNPRYQAYFPGQELRGRPLREVLPETDEQGIIARFDGVYQTGEPYRGQAVEVWLDFAHTGQREQVFLDLFYYPLRDARGRITGILDFSYDVTAQVRARRELGMLAEQLRILNEELEHRVATRTQTVRAHAAEARRAHADAEQQRASLVRFLSQTKAAICVLRGPAHVLDYCNPVFERLFSGGPLPPGRPLAEVFPGAVAQGLVPALDGVYRTGTSFFGVEQELALASPAHQPAHPRYFTFSFDAHQEHGRTAGVSIFAHDVTDQVRARAEAEVLHQRQQALFEQAPVAMGVFAGPNYVVEVCNPGLQAIWGRTAGQVLHRPLFEALPEVRDQGFKELLDRVRATGEPHVAHEMRGEVLRAGQPATVYLNFVYHPLRDAQGRITAVAAVASDVSEQVAARHQLALANQELMAANQQLTRTNADLDTFVYTASHDLKTPVANIEGLLLALREELPLAALQTGLVPSLLDRMQGAVERFQLTIAQLTDVARLQQAHALPAETVDLATLVDDLRLDLALLLATSDTRLVLHVAACPQVSFAPQHLRSIVYNLLSNAIKYRAPGRPPHVQLRCRSTAALVVLEVEDNGLGLTETQQCQLFGMFIRLHDHVDGAGLGLYMVKRLVENAGGTIAVASQAGVGSTFTVTLPRSAGSGEEEAAT